MASAANDFLQRNYTVRLLDIHAAAAVLESPSAPSPGQEEFDGPAGYQDLAEGLAALGLADDHRRSDRHPAAPAFGDRLMDKLAAHKYKGPLVAVLGQISSDEARLLAPAAEFGSHAFALIVTDRPQLARASMDLLRAGGWRTVAVSPKASVAAAWAHFDLRDRIEPVGTGGGAVTVMLERPTDRRTPGTSGRGGGRRPSPGFAPWLMSTAVAVAVLLTAANLHGVLEGWSWLFQVAVTVCSIEAATGLARRLDWSPLTGALLGLAALVMSVNAMFLAPTSFLGVIPGPGTFAALDPMLEDARDTVVSQVAPVLVNNGIALAACVGVGLIALLVDTLAVPLQMPAISGLGLLGLASVPAMIKPNSIGAAGFLAAAAGYLLLLGCAHWLASDGGGRGRLASAEQLRRASGIAAAGLAAALVLPLAIPGFSSGLFPEGSRLNWGSPTGLNPVVSLGDNLRRPGAFGRMTYATDAQEPLYLRSVTLENLTGARWSPSAFGGNKRTGIDELDVPGVQDLLAAGEVTTTLISTASFTSPWLLAPYAPAQVSGARGQWSWDPSTLNIRGSPAPPPPTRTMKCAASNPQLTRDVLRAAEPTDNAVVDPVFSELPGQHARHHHRLPAEAVTRRTGQPVRAGHGHPDVSARRPASCTPNRRPWRAATTRAASRWWRPSWRRSPATASTTPQPWPSWPGSRASPAGWRWATHRGAPPETVFDDGPGGDLKEFEVDSRDAHAWPELFFSGVGWVCLRADPVTRRAAGLRAGPNHPRLPHAGRTTS